MSPEKDVPDLSEREAAALHELEVGVEWLHRAHGHLVAFHHAVGHGMDHLFDAEDLLRESGHDRYADGLRDDILPRGVTEDDRWTYELLEAFQMAFLADVTDFERETREGIADGARHVAERTQQREWRDRAQS